MPWCASARGEVATGKAKGPSSLPPFFDSLQNIIPSGEESALSSYPAIVASIGLGLWLNSMSAGELQWNSVNCSSSIIGVFSLLEYSSTYQDQKHLDLKDPLM